MRYNRILNKVLSLKRIVVWSIFLFIFHFYPLLSYGIPISQTSSLSLMPDSITSTNDVRSLIINPALLAANTDYEIGFFWAWEESEQETGFVRDKGLFLKADFFKSIPVLQGSIAFSVEWLKERTDAPDDYMKYTFGKGFRLIQGLYCGFSLNWFSSQRLPINDLYSINFGIAYRPTYYLSFAIAAKDITQATYQGAELPISWEFGIGFRPFWNDLTLSLDVFYVQHEPAKHIGMDFGLQLRFLDGIKLTAFLKNLRFVHSENQELFLGVGLQFHISYLELITSSLIQTSWDYFEGSTGIIITSQPVGSIIPDSEKYIHLVLENEINEINQGIYFFGGGQPTLMDYIQIIQKATQDESVKGIILDIRGVGISFAGVQELRGALIAFKNQGKQVIAYIKSGWNKDYYLATIADHIYIPPSSYLSLVGLSVSLLFYKDFLSMLGIEVEILTTGEYKTGYNIYSEADLTSEHRENLQMYFDDINQQFLQEISENRGLSSEAMQELIDNGPYTSLSARDQGLIDGMRYFEEIEEELSDYSIVKGTNYQNDPLRDIRWAEKPEIAIVFITGTLITGKSINTNIFGTTTTGDESVIKILENIAQDSNIKGVIIRLDSGGGSALASDQIYNAVKGLNESKPVYVSMSSIAASGAYYIAMGSQNIYANQSTITGSIGVLIGKPNLEGSLDYLQIHPESLPYGENSQITSFYEPFSEHQRNILQQRVNETYEFFIQSVMESRGLERSEVESFAGGHIWSGEDALERDMITDIAGLPEVITMMQQEVNLSFGDYSLSIFPKTERDLLSTLIDTYLLGGSEEPVLPDTQILNDLFSLYMLQQDYILSLLPYRIEIH